jgi:hypothetical protein
MCLSPWFSVARGLVLCVSFGVVLQIDVVSAQTQPRPSGHVRLREQQRNRESPKGGISAWFANPAPRVRGTVGHKVTGVAIFWTEP